MEVRGGTRYHCLPVYTWQGLTEAAQHLVPELNRDSSSEPGVPRHPHPPPGSLALLSRKRSFPSEARGWETAHREGPDRAQEKLTCLLYGQLQGPEAWPTQVAFPAEPPASGFCISVAPPMPPVCPSSPHPDVHRNPRNRPSPTPGPAPEVCSWVYKYQKEDRK